MKRIILFFAVCLGLSVSQTTLATDAETVRAAQKRTQTNTVSVNTNSNRSVVSETKRTTGQQNKNTRTAVKPTQQRVVSRPQPVQTSNKTRTTIQPTKNTTNVISRTSVPARNTTNSRTTTVRKKTSTQNSTARSTRSPVYNSSGKRSVRAGNLNAEKISDIKSADYSKCKTVYYECMDEFCANKDTNLRRCACSTRIHEFDNIKKQLNTAEDKMLDFNQRLLTVSLDKEDAATINVASEGELAFNTTDHSESEKMLKKITNALNDSGDSKLNNNLSAISLSLDMDTAWDNIDSLSGIATTAKNGLDLYNAAHPVCLEMAKEVCSGDELTVVQDGYKLTIQQDCNTVAKSYNTMYNKAMEKIHESSALLDISRLTVHQQRNSDDILTCKKKILTQLSDASVCGEKLYKCLDMTGEYIDPSTGKAFLSENLYNLTNLLQEPTGDEKWSKLSQNESFVKFLNSKKTFLEPAIEQCQDISDTIWKEFLDDALSQIKLAQNAKMEEIKQSCTTLVAECKTNALTDLSEFDSRSLSIFSVIADKTANEMCSDIQNSCVALINTSADNTWESGMTGIATNITYNAIIDTCTQIGRDCIIQKCNGTAGNFALCMNTTSDNRISILKHEACWDKVLDCVKQADNLQNMTDLPIVNNRATYYSSLYNGQNYNNAPEFCPDTLSSTEKTACLIAEQIWGNCQQRNDDTIITTLNSLSNSISSNKILIPNTGSTLLSWFAANTGTTNADDSCSTYGCPINYQLDNSNVCQPVVSEMTSDCHRATNRNKIVNVIISSLNSLNNYCETGVRDVFFNCCASGHKDNDNGICVPGPNYNALHLVDETCSANDNYYCPNHNSNNPRVLSIYCITTDSYVTVNTINNNTSINYTCDHGAWYAIDQHGNYLKIPLNNNNNPSNFIQDTPMRYYPACTDCNSCNNLSYRQYKFDAVHTPRKWKWLDENQTEQTEISDSNSVDNYVPVPTNNEFIIDFN